MSDSETEPTSKAAVSRAIRDVVISIHKAGNDDDLTVNHVRNGAEQKLGLSTGFLKKDEWKNESKKLIREAVERYCGEETAPDPSPKKPSKAKPKEKPELRKKATKPTSDGTSRGIKRKAAAPAKKPQKRRRTVLSDEESEAALSDSPTEADDPSNAESEPALKPARRQKKVIAEESEDEEITPQRSQPGKETKDAGSEDNNQEIISRKDTERPATPPLATTDDGAESDLSSVLDESPVKKRRRTTEKPVKAAKSAKSAKASSKTKPAKTEDSPDQGEIKRLQGWLVKCGIRKVWGKELANCDTAKDKIRHLKSMLKDAGMDGKFSVEKAAKIKEQREFAKDLEEIQAGAAAWGETTSTGRPRRAAARPVQTIVFSEDSDDEDEKAQKGKEEGTDDDNDDDDDDDDEVVHSDSGSDESARRQDDEDIGGDSD